MPRRLLFPMSLLAASLIMAGCSYTPARVETRPLIEVEGDRGFCPPGLRMQGRCGG